MSTLFVELLGEAAFAKLPPRVQALHRASGTRDYRGIANVAKGSNAFARMCGWATALPPAAQAVPLRVEIATQPQREIWTRCFNGHSMRSRLWAYDGLLCERLGLVTFAFELAVEGGALLWRVRGVRTLGVSLPVRWFKGVAARESEQDGRYRFEVIARLPLVGLLVQYQGWLDVE